MAGGTDEYGMSEEHRSILKTFRCQIVQDLLVEQVLQRMPDTFSRDDREQIRAKITQSDKADKFLDLLSARGKDAFGNFVRALLDVQRWMGEWLAQEGDVEMNATNNPTGHCVGMDKLHRHALMDFSNCFNKEKLDTEKLTNELFEKNIFNKDTREDILQQKSSGEKIERFLDHLTKSGPKAFEVFYRCLQSHQPQLANKFKMESQNKYPGITFEDFIVPVQEDVINIDSKFSDVPQNVKKLIFTKLDAPNPIFDNDWRLLYKKLRLPAGKEDAISNNESQKTIEAWISKNGDKATLKILLLCLLNECHHGELVSQVKKKLNITTEFDQFVFEQQHGSCNTVTDGIAGMRIDHTPAPITKIEKIPINQREALLELLSKIDLSTLGEIATKITGKRCYCTTHKEFLEKIEEYKTRKLFNVFRKGKHDDLSRWMRNNLPVGSTGPMKEADDTKASEMRFENRQDITKHLNITNKWNIVASKIGKSSSDIAYLEQRSKDPAESVLRCWQVRSQATVGALYDLLVDCQCPAIADLL